MFKPWEGDGLWQKKYTPKRIVAKLRRVDALPGAPASAELILQGRKHAQEHARASMEKALGKQPELDLIAAPAKESQAIDVIREKKSGSAITQDEVDRLRANTWATSRS